MSESWRRLAVREPDRVGIGAEKYSRFLFNNLPGRVLRRSANRATHTASIVQLRRGGNYPIDQSTCLAL